MFDRSTFWTMVGVTIDSMIMQVAPCFILSVSTLLILIKLREVRERRRTLNKHNVDSECARADQTGSALLAIVILFLICELPIASIVFASIFDFAILRNVVARVNYFSFVLRLLNASLNFILYCLMSSQFRDEFRKVFWTPKLVRVLSFRSESQVSRTRETLEMTPNI